MNDHGIISVAQTPIGIIEVSPGVIIEVTKKPSWFHRAMMKLLLGWNYADLENKKQMLYG